MPAGAGCPTCIGTNGSQGLAQIATSPAHWHTLTQRRESYCRRKHESVTWFMRCIGPSPGPKMRKRTSVDVVGAALATALGLLGGCGGIASLSGGGSTNPPTNPSK